VDAKTQTRFQGDLLSSTRTASIIVFTQLCFLIFVYCGLTWQKSFALKLSTTLLRDGSLMMVCAKRQIGADLFGVGGYSEPLWNHVSGSVGKTVVTT